MKRLWKRFNTWIYHLKHPVIALIVTRSYDGTFESWCVYNHPLPMQEIQKRYQEGKEQG